MVTVNGTRVEHDGSRDVHQVGVHAAAQQVAQPLARPVRAIASDESEQVELVVDPSGSALVPGPARTTRRGRGAVGAVASPWEVASISTTPLPADPTEAVSVETGPQGLGERFTVHAPRPAGARIRRVTAPPPSPDPAFTWVGAHGGAGVTSLEVASGVGVALSGHWPDPALGWPSAAAVVCRSDAAGFAAASRFLAEAAAGVVSDLDVLALIVVADAPVRLGSAGRARLFELTGTVPLVVRIPWIRRWRDHPYTQHRSARDAAAKVTAAINSKENR